MTKAQHHGLLLLDKKPGVSSFDSLFSVKRAFATGKAGHTGTLDKFASGLLAVLVGKGVKLASLFRESVKEYTGIIRFGSETDTLDPEGAVIARSPVPSRKEIEAALGGFRGCIMQAPPEFSALHVGGRRAYELAREGKSFEMAKRQITVHALELTSYAPPDASVFARVSSGTYIRSLARDIALAAGSRAHLFSLRRTAVGEFRLEDAVEDKGDTETLISALRPLDRAFFDAFSIPSLYIDDEKAESFIRGRSIAGILDNPESCLQGSQHAGVFRKSAPCSLLGVIEKKSGTWGYMHVFADS